MELSLEVALVALVELESDFEMVRLRVGGNVSGAAECCRRLCTALICDDGECDDGDCDVGGVTDNDRIPGEP